jgi:hypothetical protein
VIFGPGRYDRAFGSIQESKLALDRYVGYYYKVPTKRSTYPTTPADLVGREGVVRLRDFVQAGFPKARILRLCEAGELERVGRGLYALPEREVSDSEALIQVAKRAPQGVFCLLTALRVHDLTDQNPSKVWLAVDRKARRPKIEWPPLEVVWWSKEVLAFGVIHPTIGGVALPITSPAKTVADAIKYRNKLGVDVAVQALRNYRRRRFAMDDLFAAARFCRVEKTLRGYLEAMS